ncbi:TPR end-of-group domain-containing protein [Candidatus Thiosymbion oneisti]|uniref:TPR end-of-group domain-containing protein n=1 Tax=Candidatus Thiosymbion oneisti TaxID=589554 RepID=UPI0013FDF666|nr:hypothetical protein [Candidatus Thiosymbion oneisti]
MKKERRLDALVWTLKEAVGQGKKCTLLIGAGCSVKAGIPTAAGFVEEIKEHYPSAYGQAAHKTYPHCMAALLPGESRDLIAEFVDRAKINWAHIAIAQLMKAGFVDRVLTVNFDPLVVQACALVGEFPAVYDFAASQLFKPADIPEKAVFHLHGQRSGFRLLNTEQEVKKHSEVLAPVFEDAGRGRMWIVVGYSGENDPVFGHLAAIPQFDNELYWITFQDNEPSSQVRKHLLQPDKYAFYIKGHDADGFFVKLAQELGCFPPDFVGRPFSHLRQMMELVADFDPPGQDAKLRVTASDWIADAIARYEEGSEPVPAEQDAEQRRSQRSAVAAQTRFLAGDYAKASEIAADTPGEEMKGLDAWAHVMEGNDLSEQAETKRGAEADGLFAAAIEKYQAALAIKPDLHQALYNWGTALYRQAKTKRGAEADRLFAAAGEKYQAALAIKPDDHETLNNWGIVLSKQAKTKSGAEADRLFAAAIEKYQAALAIEPDDHWALYNWGTALSEQAGTKRGAEADELFAAAGEKYRAALAIKPDKYEALCNWGSALSEQAETKTGAEADGLFAAAVEKYQAALAIKPDKHEALNNWGSALLDQAGTKRGAEAEGLYRAAAEKLSRAEALAPGYAAYNLACLAALQGQEAEALSWLLKAREAGILPDRAHLEQDPDLDGIRNSDRFQAFLTGPAA